MQTVLRTDFYSSDGRISDGKAKALYAEGQKWCPMCKRVRLFSAFNRNRSVRNGFNALCRQCARRQHLERVARIADIPDATAMARFMAKVRKISNGCWLWRGAWDENGHGLFVLRGKTVLAHRAAYEVFDREVPAGMTSWQTCRVPPCVNPDHVIFCTRRDLSTKYAKDNPFARNARKDKCDPHHHPFTPDNTNWHVVVGTKGGVGRICIACHKLRRPNTTIKPNSREDALSKRSVLLTELAFDLTKRVNVAIRDDVRGELMAVLLARKSVPREDKLKALVKRLSTAEWKMLPNAFGQSLDAPLGDDGGTMLDLVPDSSVFAEPELLWSMTDEDRSNER